MKPMEFCVMCFEPTHMECKLGGYYIDGKPYCKGCYEEIMNTVGWEE